MIHAELTNGRFCGCFLADGQHLAVLAQPDVAIVVPVADFLRLRALEQAAAPDELEDAEDTAAMLEWQARDAAGQTTLVSAEEAKLQLSMPQ
jgi:hypothetical protein